MILYSYRKSPDRLLFSVSDNIAELKADYRFMLHTNEGMLELLVDRGFRWKGQSFPVPKRFFWTDEDDAYLVHDAIYHNIGLCRDAADSIMRGMLRHVGRGRIYASSTCWACNTFVRSAFGGDSEMMTANLERLFLRNCTVNHVIHPNSPEASNPDG